MIFVFTMIVSHAGAVEVKQYISGSGTAHFFTELRFPQHPGIQDGRGNLEKGGRSGYNVMCFVAKLIMKMIESIKVDEKIK